MVWYSNGGLTTGLKKPVHGPKCMVLERWAKSLIYARCLRWRHESEWAHNKYIRKQDGVHLSGIKRLGCPAILKSDHMASDLFSTIWIPKEYGIEIPTVFKIKILISIQTFSLLNIRYFVFAGMVLPKDEDFYQFQYLRSDQVTSAFLSQVWTTL